MRLAIAGGPRCGKTTAARKIGGAVYSTDDLIDLGWSEASEAASEWFDLDAPSFVVEGVAVPRALRKWLARNPDGRPCDQVRWMGDPFERLTRGQAVMFSGCSTVMREIVPELRRRGVDVTGWRE